MSLRGSIPIGVVERKSMTASSRPFRAWRTAASRCVTDQAIEGECDLFLWCLTTATSEQLVHTISHAQLKNMRQAANPLTRIETFFT
jgi:hypothetical protein